MKVYIIYAHSKTWTEIISVHDSYEKAKKVKEKLEDGMSGVAPEIYFIMEREVFWMIIFYFKDGTFSGVLSDGCMIVGARDIITKEILWWNYCDNWLH